MSCQNFRRNNATVSIPSNKRKWDRIIGFNETQTETVKMRMIAYDVTAIAFEEYLQMSKSTAMEFLKEFSTSIANCFAPTNLHKPNLEEKKDSSSTG